MTTLDRRRRKSQKAIVQAFLQLLLEKNVSDITINEIAAKADVSRGTVYANFSDKYDLLDRCIEVKVNELFSYCMNLHQDAALLSKEILVDSFAYLAENAEVFKALFNENGNDQFKKHFLRHSVATLRQEKVFTERFDATSEIAAQFYAAAITGVIEWWIVQDMPCSEEEVVTGLWQLIEHNM